jgi:hypothetical protein
MLLDEIDRGQKQLAIEPVQVETARRLVRGGDHDHLSLEQPFEEAPEDHRIGDVRHVQFIEAEKLRVVRDAVGDER